MGDIMRAVGDTKNSNLLGLMTASVKFFMNRASRRLEKMNLYKLLSHNQKMIVMRCHLEGCIAIQSLKLELSDNLLDQLNKILSSTEIAYVKEFITELGMPFEYLATQKISLGKCMKKFRQKLRFQD